MSNIFAINRLRTDTDGQGIRTLVTFSGCPLNCRYCINPECHNSDMGTDYSPHDLYEIVKIDDLYFRMSGGGVTFGGGEPLMNLEFIQEFIKIVPEEWSIDIETSFNVPWDNIMPLIGRVEKWKVDIKDMNGEIYQAYTGQSNELVIHNLEMMDRINNIHKLYLRVPEIAGYNNKEDIKRSLDALKKYDCFKETFKYINNLGGGTGDSYN